MMWKSLGYQALAVARRITLRQMGICRQMINPQDSWDYLEVIAAERQKYCSPLGNDGTKLKRQRREETSCRDPSQPSRIEGHC